MVMCEKVDNKDTKREYITSTGMTSTKRQINHLVATIDHAHPQLTVRRYTSGHFFLDIHRHSNTSTGFTTSKEPRRYQNMT